MTTAEKIVKAWEDGKINMGKAVEFTVNCGLCHTQTVYNDMATPDEYTFMDSSVLFVDWAKSELYC